MRRELCASFANIFEYIGYQSESTPIIRVFDFTVQKNPEKYGQIQLKLKSTSDDSKRGNTGLKSGN